MIEKITSDEEHQAALDRINQLMDVKPGTVEGAELDRLVELVELYEKEHYPMPESFE